MKHYGLFVACSFCVHLRCWGLVRPNPVAPQKIPITVLSGFLGSGKTTLLEELLYNNEGLRIAVIVNDMAEVNVDSKLVKQRSVASGIVELQNGCACCSKSEELLSSVAELVTLSDLNAEGGFDHIVVEMSGVGDPRSVRAKFQEAIFYDMPLLERVQLDTLVTLVDCSPQTFVEYLQSSRMINAEESPELFPQEASGANADDTIPGGLLAALGASHESTMIDDTVGTLLVSQTEIADIVLLTKVDLAKEVYVKKVEDIVRAVNPLCAVRRAQFGKVPVSQVLAAAHGVGIVQSGVLDDHRDAVEYVDNRSAEHSSQDHSHGHAHDTVESSVESSHSHSHQNEGEGVHHRSHGHGHDRDESSSESSHSHSHQKEGEDIHHHSHAHGTDEITVEASHSHSHQNEEEEMHDHSHDYTHGCDDPDCLDPSHSHSHQATHAGIGSFVYRARRPFHPGRLTAFLRNLPVSRGIPEADGASSSVVISPGTEVVLEKVIRSKGFTWMADSHSTALYWSQAGSNFDVDVLGSWWATLRRARWPSEAVEGILQDFDSHTHDDSDPSMKSVGDRRQELVFIGQSLGTRGNQLLVEKALDQCLLNDEEWQEYKTLVHNEDSDLATVFVNPLTQSTPVAAA